MKKGFLKHIGGDPYLIPAITISIALAILAIVVILRAIF